MLTALNTKEAHCKQKCDKHENMPKFKFRDLIMIKNFEKKIELGCKICTQFFNSKIKRY